MRLSQGHLKLLETCPRKFQHLYLEQLAAPIAAEQVERLTWGSRFHRLLQQRELALPIAPLLEADPQLAQQFHTFTMTVPDIASLSVPEPGLRESEHERTIECQGYSLVVVYDLLIADTEQAHILDWKTYAQPSQPQRLQQDWQTRLYLWVLAATSTYAPERLKMTYWFAQGEREGRSEQGEARGEKWEAQAATIADNHRLTRPT
ncbi:PD-(D/E)XK nuclease family protein, partial [Trichothermofontia sp.]